jgi:urease accessory protein
VHASPGTTRVALIAASALLLGGDAVSVRIEVGAGAHLEIVEVAGTVAYPGPPSRWEVDLTVGPGASLLYRGLPFVVSTGADVVRRFDADMVDGASRLLLRETLVLGRHGEAGGRVVSDTRVRVGGREVLIERQALSAESRLQPGVLAGCRVLDTVLDVGGPPTRAPRPAASLLLPAAAGVLHRWLGQEAAESPLDPLAS